MKSKPSRDDIRELLREEFPSLPWGPFPQQLPLAKAGDVIEVHLPPIGVWHCDAVVRDVRGHHYYRISRKVGGATEYRTIATAGIEILSSKEGGKS